MHQLPSFGLQGCVRQAPLLHLPSDSPCMTDSTLHWLLLDRSVCVWWGRIEGGGEKWRCDIKKKRCEEEKNEGSSSQAMQTEQEWMGVETVDYKLPAGSVGWWWRWGGWWSRLQAIDLRQISLQGPALCHRHVAPTAAHASRTGSEEGFDLLRPSARLHVRERRSTSIQSTNRNVQMRMQTQARKNARADRQTHRERSSKEMCSCLCQ